MTQFTARLRQGPHPKGKELWLGGTVSPLARRQLEKLGWKVETKVAAKLGG